MNVSLNIINEKKTSLLTFGISLALDIQKTFSFKAYQYFGYRAFVDGPRLALS